MKSRIISTTVIVVLLAAGAFEYVYYQNAHRPCANPLTYTIGTFDTRFGVSRADFLLALRQAVDVWNMAAGKTLFIYDQNGFLPINLIYDTRQATTQKDQTLETNISQGKESADVVKQQYTSLKAAYDADETAYESELQNYNQKLDAYNQEVSYWNSRDGADAEEYQKLNAEKAELDSERSSLEVKRAAINSEATQINALIDTYNLVVNHVNANVTEINQTAGREFNEGEFVSDASGERINIYEFQNEDKLIRVLAHEFGHALGLGHNGNPASIMYYLNQNTNITPSKDDIASLKALCNLK